MLGQRRHPAVHGRARGGILQVNAAAVAAASTLTRAARACQHWVIPCTFSAVQGRARDGLLHVDAAASQHGFISCTLGALQGRACDGRLHVDAATVAAATLTLAVSKSSLLFVLHLGCSAGSGQ